MTKGEGSVEKGVKLDDIIVEEFQIILSIPIKE